MDQIYRFRQGMGGRYALERDGGLYWLEGHVFGDYHFGMLIEETGLKVAPPVVPSKIIAIGLNYKDHAAEMKKALPAEPLVFSKPPTSVDRAGCERSSCRCGPAASITKRRWRW